MSRRTAALRSLTFSLRQALEMWRSMVAVAAPISRAISLVRKWRATIWRHSRSRAVKWSNPIPDGKMQRSRAQPERELLGAIPSKYNRSHTGGAEVRKAAQA